MRYQEIIDYANETQAQRLARLALMYGVDDREDRAEDAQTDLTRAKTEKSRADALAAIVKIEAEYEERALDAEQDLISDLNPNKALTRPE